MKITTYTVDEFLENLQNAQSIFEDSVRVSTIRRPVDGNSRSSVKFDVVFQASAVVLSNSGDSYLLEVGQECGTDYNDSTQDMEGTNEAQQLESKVAELCESRGWRLLPGIITP